MFDQAWNNAWWVLALVFCWCWSLLLAATPESAVLLLQVHWWRLVLDEALLVGGGLSSSALMATHLTARHRWCVTGTPIGSGERVRHLS
jgi:SNF2 family DNA or RNA helicase